MHTTETKAVQVDALIEEGLSKRETAKRLNLSRPAHSGLGFEKWAH